MRTVIENSREVGNSCYWGDHGDWLIAASVHRDSDALGRSNFEVMRETLMSLPEVKEWDGEYNPVVIERFNHWAVGWVDYLVIDPDCNSAVERAEQMRKALEDYPVLDDDHYSRTEQEEANTVWQDCFSARGRIAYVREHRSQFEFRCWRDLLECIRGKWFGGYASELLR